MADARISELTEKTLAEAVSGNGAIPAAIGSDTYKVPASDLASAAQGAKADTAYQKPDGGIPKADLEDAVQEALDTSNFVKKTGATGQTIEGGLTAKNASAALDVGTDVSGENNITVNADNVVAITANTMARIDAANITLNPKPNDNYPEPYVQVNGMQIKYMATPTEDHDAATKQYVDEVTAHLGARQPRLFPVTENVVSLNDYITDDIILNAGDADITINGYPSPKTAAPGDLYTVARGTISSVTYVGSTSHAASGGSGDAGERTMPLLFPVSADITEAMINDGDGGWGTSKTWMEGDLILNVSSSAITVPKYPGTMTLEPGEITRLNSLVYGFTDVLYRLSLDGGGNGEDGQDGKNGFSIWLTEDAAEDVQTFEPPSGLMPDGKIWMTENLNIDLEDGQSWTYNNDPANGDVYGRLYTWQGALDAVPAGWHLPTREEWQGLVDAVEALPGNGAQTAGRELKSTSGWIALNGQDTHGFAALPGGYGVSNDYFSGDSYIGYWWTATEFEGDFAYYRFMSYQNNSVSELQFDKSYARLSVRLIKDA